MKHHIGVSSPFQSYLLLSRIFCTMNKLHTLIYSVLIFTCLSCQQQTPQTQIEQTAIDFVKPFIISIIRSPKNGARLLLNLILVS